jgi:hypothetical protein
MTSVGRQTFLVERYAADLSVDVSADFTATP